ncbi:E3 ubiquitin-protein ligase TRIM45 [Anabrus simplex]|uniref:E3 ubiquitin-protein ligase TRIM45 n=1 Tax=Anabrus simplex TaxID=316456 RepID=UPI0035A316EF
MEVDHTTAIFGSFSRRRQSEELKTPKRRPQTTAVAPMPAPAVPRRTRPTTTGQESTCPVCKRQFIEPRVLPCLHTVCAACLQQQQPPLDGNAGGSVSSSSGSGYESEPRGSEGDGLLECPVCGTVSRVPAGGVMALPPNYVMQHRMVLASLNKDTTRLLCDLCSSDLPACNRCSDCLLSMCAPCTESHRRQRNTAGHEVLTLQEARQRGITRVRRQIMCPIHPELELRVYCAPCAQVACRECCMHTHRGHSCEALPRAAHLYTRNVKDALEQAKPEAERAAAVLERLQQIARRIQARCTQVQEEVDRFMDSYAAALEKHRQDLQLQIRDATDAKLAAVRQQQRELERRVQDASTAVRFTEDLLTEGSDVEVLSLAAPILRRLENIHAPGGIPAEPRVSEVLHFLPGESAGMVQGHPLFGLVTTQTVAASRCVLNTDSLLDCRQHKRAEAIVETRDSEGQPLCHGGEKVVVELRYCDVSNRRIPVHVTDRRDGTYLLAFVPDSPGNLRLAVSVHGTAIQGSPFPVCVQTQRPHQGVYHCCSFCSSGGRKEATCGCGGTMPGGYQGCGHGHTGHPGRRHWSCCGNILENSECGGRSGSAVYQFTL